MTSADIPTRRPPVGPVSVVRPLGELDVETAAALTAQVTTALRRSHLVVVDLSAVTFLDCSAIGGLVALAHQAGAGGGRLRVAALPQHAHRLFASFDLYDVLGGRGDVAGECRDALDHRTAARGEHGGGRRQVPA